MWHYDFDGDSNILETYVSYLRKKINQYGPPLIHTVRLVGYVLRETGSTSDAEQSVMSLRARLVAAVCVVSLVALGSAGIATYALFSQSQLRQIDDSLQRTHEPLETLIASEGGSAGDQLGTAVDNDGGTTDGGAGVTDADHDLDRSIEQLAPGQLVIVLDPSQAVEVSVPAREPGHEPALDRCRRSHAPARKHRRFPRPAVVLHTDRRRRFERTSACLTATPTAACSSSVSH